MRARITAVLVLVLLSSVALATQRPGQLSPEEMGEIVGVGCSEAVGIMTGFAFAAGYTNFAIAPLSLGFLAAAALFGAYVVVAC